MHLRYWLEGSDNLWIWYFFECSDFKKHSVLCVADKDKCQECCTLLENLSTPIERSYYNILSKNEDILKIFDKRVAGQSSLLDSNHRLASGVMYRGDYRTENEQESYASEKFFAMLISGLQKIIAKAEGCDIDWHKSAICMKFQAAHTLPRRLFHVHKTCQPHVLLSNLEEIPLVNWKHRKNECFTVFDTVRESVFGKHIHKFIKI